MSAPRCPYCGAAAQLVTGAKLYPHRPDLAHLKAWQCYPCAASVGCHDGTTTPKGPLADGPTRRARFGKARGVYGTRRNERGLDESYLRYTTKDRLTVAGGRDRVLIELERMGAQADTVVISTNVELRRDGLPMSGRRDPEDPGVAVYWIRGGQARCMAVDRYDTVADNLAAIAATLDAMRAIDRHGSAEILDRAFSGFVALPAPEQPFQVLGVSATASDDEIERAYRRLAAQHHPDRGGDAETMARINAARDAMRAARASTV